MQSLLQGLRLPIKLRQPQPLPRDIPPSHSGRPHSLLVYLLLLTLVVSLPSLGVAVLTGISDSRILAQIHQRERHRIAGSLAQAVEGAFADACAALEAIDIRALPEANGPEADAQRLLTLAAATTGAGFRLMDTQGHTRLQAHAASLAEPAAARPDDWRHTVLQSGVIGLGGATATEGQHQILIPLLRPLRQDGVVIGLLEMQLPSEKLAMIMRRTVADAHGTGLLIDPEGHIAAASFQAEQAAAVPDQPIAAQSPDDPDLITVELHHQPGWRVLYRHAQPDPDLTAGPLGRTMLGCLVSLLISAALISVLGRRAARRVASLAELARSVTAGGDRAPVTPRMRIAEFEDLRQSMLRADAVLRRRGAAERMALREARTGHELLISVVNGTAESIHVKDLELRYVLVNRAGLQTAGAALEEWQVLGRRTADLFPEALAQRIEAADRLVLETGQISSFEQEFRTGNAQETRWIAMTITPWQDAQGRVVGVVSVSRDVTEQRRAEQRLRHLQAELLRTSRLSAMGAMAAGLAHELNQPLAAATNYLNASGRLLDRADQHASGAPNPSLRLARETVLDAADQMLRAGDIVRRLRDFVDRGEAELQTEDIGELLRETCDLLRSDGVNAGIALAVTVDPGLSPVLADRVQIGQVLLNLVRNAAEAIGPQRGDGRIDVRARLEQGSAGQGAAAVIEVADNGPGLSPVIAERLFEPFVSTKRAGMGIGLAICRTIVEGHGGWLTAHAGACDGMVFRILLPVLPRPGEPA